MKNKLFVRLLLTLLLLAPFAASTLATGYYGPMFYLDQGGANVAASPEFYWELEVKRLAREFHPPEKLFEAPPTFVADETDFAAALREGKIKPASPDEAMQQQLANRSVVERANPAGTETLQATFASEFADYHRGAFAFKRGPAHYAEAREAWEGLLRRPETERHYRSAWAAFMLGKLALRENDPAAAGWFQHTRELVRAGFSDSLGLAADSYGWEARSEWKQDHPEKAAELYLTQLALGDASAIVSLKALVPDRKPVDGFLNYDDVAEEKVAAQLERAARDPLLRRLITVHVLATVSVSASWYYDRDDSALQRSARWLKMVQEQKLTQLEDAEYLGWAAYNSGDYTGAAHWLELAQKNSPATLWLRAKLQRRAGKISEAAKSMAQAWQSLRESPIYALSDDADADGPNCLFRDLHWAPMESATGDLGALRLERSEYLLALETLLQGDLWSDAAFVAERVLRTNELKAYIDEHSAAAGEKTAPRWKNLRYLLGRRLVREERYDEAVAYLPQPYDQVLRKYAAALRAGRDRSRAEKERARSLFTAAWLARHEGMELMGTEGAPDNFSEAGNFEASDLAQQIQSGTYRVTDYLQAGGPQVMTKKIALRLPSRARSRLTNSEVEPNRRFHYRYLASALALRAAALLPNDSEELADVVNCAGHWVKNTHEKLGNRYYQVLEQRAANTAIGRAALAHHWFVDERGPWSEAETQAHEALRKELNFPPEN